MFSVAYIEIRFLVFTGIVLLFKRYFDTVVARLGRSQTWQY